MQTANKLNDFSWQLSADPLVLSEIFLPQTSIAIWQRRPNERIASYFQNIFSSLGLGLNGVYSLKHLKQSLDGDLPQADGKNELVEDIYLIADMLTCLFDCEDVGLRLVPLTQAMCPSFHVDNIQVRLVTTYLGAGTQWLPLESLQNTQLKNDFLKTNFNQYYHPQDIQQIDTFDVALLKGKAWHGHESRAAVHRSCKLLKNQQRVLLSLDPM